MLRRIIKLLIEKGYAPIDTEVEGLFFREEKDVVYAVTLSRAVSEDNTEEYTTIQRRIEFTLATRLCKKVQCLHIVLTQDGMFRESEYQLMEKLDNVWLIASDTGKVYIFERQITEFDGLKEELERVLPEVLKKKKKESYFYVAPVNTGIIAINILYYLLVIIIHGDMLAVYDSEIMLSMGAMSYETIVAGAWYQIITSCFLHFGLDHLLNNMVLLAYTGYELEKCVGSVRYALLYFAAGIIGNVASFVFYSEYGEQIVSAGASGAIYGVLGALLVVLVIKKIGTPDLSPRRIFIMIALTIYHGLTSTGVDNAAHIGGLAAGIIGGFLLSKISQYGKLVEVNFMR